MCRRYRERLCGLTWLWWYWLWLLKSLRNLRWTLLLVGHRNLHHLTLSTHLTLVLRLLLLLHLLLLHFLRHGVSLNIRSICGILQNLPRDILSSSSSSRYCWVLPSGNGDWTTLTVDVILNWRPIGTLSEVSKYLSIRHHMRNRFCSCHQLLLLRLT